MEKVIIYADGGSRGNGSEDSIGGYGVFLQYGGHTMELKEGFRKVTNNQMEIRAAIAGLKAMKKTNIPVEVRSDSAYVVNCMTKGWYQRWLNNGWRTAGNKPVENRELWLELIEQVNRFPFISFVKVKGHSGEPGNERADSLANEAIDSVTGGLQ